MSSIPRNLKECVPEFERILSELEQLAQQTAVHRKKFEFSVNQFRRFLTMLNQNAKLQPMAQNQVDGFRQTCSKLRELHLLLCQHQAHCWAQTTLENPCDSVASQLSSIATDLRKATVALDKESSNFFDDDSKDWVPYHILDIKNISISFHQYKEGPVVDPQTVIYMDKRLKSIDSFLKKYENDATISPGVRVFSPIPVHYQSWRIAPTDLQEVEEIGSGASANVFYGYYKKTGETVAIKKLHCKKLVGRALNYFKREISILATAIHPTILKFVGATETAPFCIVTEWMPNRTLFHQLHSKKSYDFSTVNDFGPTLRTIAAFDIARGMQFLHSKHIIHRDLKSLNVLLDENYHVRICDFGFSRLDNEDEFMTEKVGTPHWMAPELLNTAGNYTSKIDIYSYGILLWEIVSGNQPYLGLDPCQVIAQVVNNDMRPSLPMAAPEPLRNMITRCWDKNPDVRPTFDEIITEFRSGTLLLNGSNRDQFLKYVVDTIGVNPIDTIEEKISSGIDLKELADTLENEGLPAAQNMITKCWEQIESSYSMEQQATIARVAHLFLETPLKARSASLMRKMSPGTINAQKAASIAMMIPSGSDEFDEDIAVIACKNGAAEYVAVYAILSRHLKLAFEVVAKQGVELSLKAAVADRCVQNLYSNKADLACAALRCLVGIGESRRITIDSIKQHIKSELVGMRNCVYVAIISISIEEQTIPAEIADILIDNLANDSLAEQALIASCRDPQTALHVINRFSNEKVKKTELIIRVLLLVAQNDYVKPAITDAIKHLHLDDLSPSENHSLALLKQYVSPEKASDETNESEITEEN